MKSITKKIVSIDFYQFSSTVIDFHRYYRFFLSELSFATHHAEGLAMATDFLLQEKYFTYRYYSKPTLMVPFHSTHYVTCHIHIQV